MAVTTTRPSTTHPSTTHPSTTGTTPATGSRRPAAIARRLVMLVLAALIFGSGLGLAPDAASAYAPGAPRHAGRIGWDGEALVGWSAPNPGDKATTAYKVERFKGDAAVAEKAWQFSGKTMWFVDKGLTNDVVYWYRIQAVNNDGASPWSVKEAVVPKKWMKTHISPFDSEADFAKRQYQDLLGRAPSASELSAAVTSLSNGYSANLTNQLAHDPARMAERHPVIRLYFAFFDRSPDLSGTNYWIKKRNAGTNLNQIASSFAASSEFVNKYGQLSNQDFVKQIYVNVFDRQPDPGGLAYWTKKLNEKKATRGQVMVGFSESTEYAGGNGTIGKSTGRVEASDLYMAIMKGSISTNGLNTYYAPHIQGGGSQGSLAMLLMPTNGYPK